MTNPDGEQPEPQVLRRAADKLVEQAALYRELSDTLLREAEQLRRWADAPAGGAGHQIGLNRSAVAILVVDDDAAITHGYATALRMEGYEVRTVGTLRDASAAAITWRPDAIILDLHLEDGDGLTLVRELRAARRTTPIAIVTGDFGLDDAVTTELQALNTELRFKPLWIDDLLELTRSLVDAS
jgi:two-component system OmpR family response regulator